MPPRLVISGLRQWHRVLSLPRMAPAGWHRQRLAEEIVELQEAEGLISRLSEESDILFTISRAHNSGYLLDEALPSCSATVYLYMVGKFTMRWAFHRTAARLAGVRGVRDVTNPMKDDKLVRVAMRHGIDGERYCMVGRRLRRWFPLLP